MIHLLAGSGLAVLSMVSALQSSSAACNDLSRTLQIPAGTTQTTTNCASWSITVLGITFSSPSSCPNSRTVRTEDTWACGPAASGLHCKARGYQVKVKQFSLDDPCPGIPATLPTTLEEANKAVQCKALPLVKEFDVWSATVSNCALHVDPQQQRLPEGGRAPRHGEVRSIGNDLYVVHHGPLDLFPSIPWELPLIDRFGLIRTQSVDELDGVLEATLITHPALPGVGELNASVVFEFFGLPDREPIRNEHHISGTVLGDRRFSVVDTGFVSTEDGQRRLSVSEYRFDGQRFIYGEKGAEYYNAFLASSSGAMEALQYEAQFIWPLLGWVQDPFWIPRVPGTTYESASRGTLVDVVERYPDIPGFGWTTYVIDTASGRAHPVRIDSFSSSGDLLMRRDFADYRAFGDEIWRPGTVTESRFDSSSGELVSRVTVRIDSARGLNAEEAATLPEVLRYQERWYVRLP